MAVTIRVENIFRRGWVPIRVENIFDADETTTSDADGQLISTAPSIRVGVGVHRVDRSQVKPHALPPAFGWSSQDGEYRLGM